MIIQYSWVSAKERQCERGSEKDGKNERDDGRNRRPCAAGNCLACAALADLTGMIPIES